MSGSARSSVVAFVSGRFSKGEDFSRFKRALLIATHLSIGVPICTLDICQCALSSVQNEALTTQHVVPTALASHHN